MVRRRPAVGGDRPPQSEQLRRGLVKQTRPNGVSQGVTTSAGRYVPGTSRGPQSEQYGRGISTRAANANFDLQKAAKKKLSRSR